MRLSLWGGPDGNIAAFNPLGSGEVPLVDSSASRLSKAPCCCPAVGKGLFSLGNDCWPPGILSQGPPLRGKPVVALSADIPLWQPVKMRWDKLDKRKPCGVIVRANYPSPGDGLSAQRMEGSCASLSVCLWIKVPCFPHGMGR